MNMLGKENPGNNLFAVEERQHSPSVFQLEAVLNKKIVDFCYLSNKFFPTDGIIGELQSGLVEGIRNYPSMQSSQQSLASQLTGYSEEEIVVGNGASELIHLLSSKIGQNWLMPFPSYMEYENVLREFGKRVHFFQLRERNSFDVDLEEIESAVKNNNIDGFVLPNPNSPTGRCLEVRQLEELLTILRRLEIVVIDESFIEFASEDRSKIPSLRPFLESWPNLVIMRSLGKDFGVCGLRLGLAATRNQSFLEKLQTGLPIWNISPLAEMFMRICNSRIDEYEDARIKCIRETQALVRGLATIPELKVFETQSNFCLVQIAEGRGKAAELRDFLLSNHGFYVRDCSRKSGLSDRYLRIGANERSMNEALVKAMKEFFSTTA